MSLSPRGNHSSSLRLFRNICIEFAPSPLLLLPTFTTFSFHCGLVHSLHSCLSTKTISREWSFESRTTRSCQKGRFHQRTRLQSRVSHPTHHKSPASAPPSAQFCHVTLETRMRFFSGVSWSEQDHVKLDHGAHGAGWSSGEAGQHMKREVEERCPCSSYCAQS